ncbi:inosine monophosphate dehydrogenase [Hortaea werneckii]|nr:inosine monophosphate dehydrogenase [Hortaea werneckii]KAI7102595.1 inosine monophosphate dehydrogenase [Hortaea werneckii]KAI7220114.1 inosine monophosphate dehydrogenase [Hortaea werneckii]KAI7331271.1 inosine monophosphate dehydrogenase [Hortaea werneckii]KAI7385451.1 inosine monophosphate dehydrogenase [Hortaea werneckii]
MTELTKDYPWTKSPLVAAAPMRLIALSRLAFEVSKAGGLGFVGAGSDVSTLEPELEAVQKAQADSPALNQIHDVLPVGVGFLLWAGDELLKQSLPILQKYKPAAVWLFAPNHPDQLAQWTKETRCVTNGQSKIWIQVGTAADAIEATKLCQPEVLVVQGSDAGGHGLEKCAGLISLLPEVDDSLTAFAKQSGIPRPALVAAGGIMDGRGTAAAVTLGASGVVLGTRYLASHEANIAKGYQNAVLNAADGGVTTARGKVYDALRGTTDWPEWIGGRSVLNESWHDHGRGMSLEENKRLYEEALKKGDEGWGEKGRLTTYAGTGVGLVREVKSAASITEEVREYGACVLKHAGSRTMASSGDLDESGFTLFRYHYIDRLSQQPWTTNAEVAAGLRWYAITEDTGGEAMQYWTRLTKKLLRGSAAPLLPEVIDNFLQGRYCAEKIDPDAECMSVPSLVSEADGDTEDQSLCHSPLEPDTFDGQECANDTTLDLQQYVATLQSLPKGPERDAQFHCARNVFAESGQSLYHFHAAVILTTAGESWSEAPLHDLIRSSWDKMPQIDRGMWRDGTTKMHAAFDLRNPNGMCHFGQVSQEAGENPSSTPVLDYLRSGEVDETEPESLIQKLLSGIGKLQADGCLPLLRLRSAGMRINYDAKATDVTSVDPQHPLLKTPQEALLNKTSYSGMQDATLIAKMEKWGLADNENGFARHIRDCFEWKGLAEDEYEDMIEQKLYAFNKATRDLLFKEVKRSRLT